MNNDASSMALTTMNPSEIVATLREGLLLLTDELTVEFARDRFLTMFQVAREETLVGLCILLIYHQLCPIHITGRIDKVELR